MSKESALAALTGTPAPAVDATTSAIAPTEAASKEELKSQAFAIFAKKEAALQKEREALKAEREAWLKDKEEADLWKKTAREFDETRKKDPIAALKAIGISEDEIVKFLNAQKGEVVEPTAEEIARKVAQEEANKIREELKKQAEDDTKAKNTKLVDGLKSNIKETINKNADKYEYCAFEGVAAERLAYEFIVAELKESNNLLSVDEALGMAEEYYEGRDKQMAGLKKRQPQPAEPVDAPKTSADVARKDNAGKAPVSNVPAAAKTLTNKVTATSTATAPTGRKETPSEKKQRLIAALSAMGR